LIYRRNDTPAEFQHLELLKLSKHYRKNGTGRPTKDRRDIDEFGNEIKNEDEEDKF
jgi:ribosome-associated heat shock protein Hsp15